MSKVCVPVARTETRKIERAEDFQLEKLGTNRIGKNQARKNAPNIGSNRKRQP